MNYVIANADYSHINGIHAIETECFSEPWSEEAIISQLIGENHVFLVALDGESVVGYVGMMYVLDEGYISNVAVTSAYRRQRIADALIDELMVRAAELELVFVTLEVRESNEPAKALYAKHGFKEVGLRKGYYTKPKENAVLMTAYLKGDEV
ncbi:MAG: ribosomal protein S18-alanine N-acetyltransferase [Oscillospiraceae bacterium]|nr:ribosomal protein S18-alanine N-acetyltransferase [Oscillospiraceae bacterium]